ncbi:MAG: InlB B-repeat-containing protein [Anaerolineaceae bacterium]|nr:InlB B-repeat-containing protein [Anaerolineaceae bacterium]
MRIIYHCDSGYANPNDVFYFATFSEGKFYPEQGGDALHYPLGKYSLYGDANTPHRLDIKYKYYYTSYADVPVERVFINGVPETGILISGNNAALSATVTPAEALNKTVTWSSNNPDIISVDDDGVITAKAPGSATITVTATNGTEDTSDDKSESCEIKVPAKVTFETNGGTAIDPQYIILGPTGGLANEPDPAPTKEGYTLDGWYTNETFEKEWRFDAAPVEGDMTLYAKWKATPAKAPTNINITGETTLEYGSTNHSISVTASAEPGHTLSYQWYSNSKKSKTGGTAITSGGTEASYVIPADKNVGTYYYYCVVTATRTDNNETQTDTSNVATVTVTRAHFESDLTMEDYTYGDTPSTPKISSNPGNGAVTYYYNTTTEFRGSKDWNNITGTTLDPGTYYMVAWIRATDNYYEKYTVFKSFSVGQRSLTPSLTGAVSKVYDGSTSVSDAASNTLAISLDDVAASDGISAAIGSAEYGSADKGTNISVTASGITLTGTKAGNYTLSASTASANVGEITQRPITVKAKDKSLGLNAQIPSTADDVEIISENSLVSGENIDSVAITGDTSAATTSGKLTITEDSVVITSGTADVTDNYSIALETGTLTVTAGAPEPDGELTTSAITYGQTLAASTISGSMKYNDAPVTGTFTWDMPDTKPTVSDSNTTDYGWTFTPDSDNYASATGTLKLTINPKPAALAWENTELTYNGEAQKPAAAVSNLEAGDNCEVTVTGEHTNYSADPYTATAAALSNSNYTLPTDNTTTFTISRRPVTITAEDQTVLLNGSIMKYPSTDPNVAVVSLSEGENEGLVSNGNVTHTLESITLTPSIETESAGTGTITLSDAVIMSGNDDVTDNYNITCEDGVLTVTYAMLTLKEVAAAGITYGQTLADSQITGSVKYVNAFDNNSETEIDGEFTWDDQTIMPTVADSGKTKYAFTFTPADSVNYAKYTGELTLTIAKAEAALTAAPGALEGLICNDSAQELVTAGEAVGGTLYYAVTAGNKAPTDESLYTTSIPTATNAGTWYVWYKVVGDANHTDTEAASVEVTIAQASITNAAVTLSETSFVYTGSEQSVTVSSVKLGEATLTADTDYEVTGGTTGTNNGSYTVTVTGKGNYKDTASAAWSIGLATPAIETLPTASAITYGQKLADSTLTGGTAKLGDNIVAGTFAWKNPEIKPAVSDSETTEYDVVFTPTDTDNYAAVECKVKLTVKKVTNLTVTFKVVNGSWDDGTTVDKTVALSGAEGDMLKLTADQIPAVGSKPSAGYKSGSWDVTPGTETAITADTTYTYTYAAEGEKEKIEQKPLNSVPAELTEIYHSISELKQAMIKKLQIGEAVLQEDQTTLYDVELLISFDGGKTWQPATEENFPESGLDITLNYPEGTGPGTHTFSLSHMFTLTSAKLGTKAGEIETPDVRAEADGLHTKLKGLSPVMIGWRAIDEEPEQSMDAAVEFINLKQDGSRGVPSEVKSLKVEGVTITLTGDETESSSEELTLTLSSNGLAVIPMMPKFDKEITDLAPGKYAVTVKGLPSSVSSRGQIYSSTGPVEGPVEWKYSISVKGEINESDGKMVVRIYLIWDDGSVPVEQIRVVALPEDEIGAYKLREDGTKEYLIFQTYDICMAYLGRDELCRGPERCYHK